MLRCPMRLPYTMGVVSAEKVLRIHDLAQVAKLPIHTDCLSFNEQN